jgi:aminoglycoside phosphotransferase (APT) family kinase protein
MEYIKGHQLIEQCANKDDRNNAIQALVKLQCKIHEIKAVGQPKLTERITYKISNSQYLDDSLIGKLLSLLNNMEDDSDYLCHGDLHLLNILNDGNKHWIIDWVDATAGNPLADACRSYLIFKMYASRSAGVYLRMYCKETKSKQDDVLKWLPLIAAARLRENIDDKMKLWLLQLITNELNDK